MAPHVFSYRPLSHLAHSLLKVKASLESDVGGEPLDAHEIRAALAAEMVRDGAIADAPVAETTANQVAARMTHMALAALARGTDDDHLTAVERDSLEAIVRVIGRPALRFSGGHVGVPPNNRANERWTTLIAMYRDEIEGVAASVGRISIGLESARRTVGTAWRIGGDAVVTNRHVLRSLVSNPDAPVASWSLDAGKNVTVDFNAESAISPPSTVSVASVAFVSEDIDLAILDLAHGAVLPPTLTLQWKIESLGRQVDNGRTFRGQDVYVIGHPQDSGSAAITRVFVEADGTKRMSPGYVTAVIPEQVAFEHDCSTLRGNSGSCVVSAATHEVVGLHYGGLGVDDATSRARANVAIAFATLGAHPAANALRGQ